MKHEIEFGGRHLCKGYAGTRKESVARYAGSKVSCASLTPGSLRPLRGLRSPGALCRRPLRGLQGEMVSFQETLTGDGETSAEAI